MARRPGSEAAADVEEEEVGENLRKVPSSAGEIPVSFWSIKGRSVPDILADVEEKETGKRVRN